MKDASKLRDMRLYAIFELYDMHTDFFRRAIEGVSDEDAHNRLGTKANHIAWIAGSIVESRFVGARNLGLDLKQEGHDLFSDFKGIQDEARYPSLSQYLADWDRVSPLLREKTFEVDAAWLDERKNMGGWEASNLEMINFSTYREANMIGQIALWRRLLGYDAMKYM
jgi:hypothetical protein